MTINERLDDLVRVIAEDVTRVDCGQPPRIVINNYTFYRSEAADRVMRLVVELNDCEAPARAPPPCGWFPKLCRLLLAVALPTA